MNPSSATGPKAPTAAWVGLFIALFGILVVRWAVSLFYPEFSFPATIWKESLTWLSVMALFFIMRRGEWLPLRSIGLGTRVCEKLAPLGSDPHRALRPGWWRGVHSYPFQRRRNGSSLGEVPALVAFFSSSCAPASSRNFSIAATRSNGFNCSG